MDDYEICHKDSTEEVISRILSDTDSSLQSLSKSPKKYTPGRKIATESTPTRKTRKRNNRIQLAEPSTKIFSMSWLCELNTQVDFLIDGITVASKLVGLCSGNRHNRTASRECNTMLGEVTNVGDVDREEQNLQNFLSDVTSRGKNHCSSPQYEQKTAPLTANQTELMKKSMKQLLETANRIKRLIPTRCKENGYEVPILSALPTGAIETPPTQTDPIDTYVEYLQVYDRVSKSSSNNSYLQKQSSPRNKFRTRNQASNRTRTVEAFHLSGDINTSFANQKVHRPLYSSYNDSSNGQIGTNFFSKNKPSYINTTIDQIEWSLPNSELEENGVRQDNLSQRDSSFKELIEESNQQIKVEERSSTDELTSELDRKQFSMRDYMSTMQQVRKRSPSTRRQEKVLRRPMQYFDFDDYYKKLINLRNTYKTVSEPTVTDITN
ncbi:uncharacterized protein TNCT_449401 [Trichonephila clavata]|uniref:Uncharacterized protein n=1 Tax=Trichonephila clavata TaxID=2740835 RepID=A0A8X6IVK7_TRICU|nr:uncharacterized protein TNCT_449401 [Trichonephila clavata]